MQGRERHHYAVLATRIRSFLRIGMLPSARLKVKGTVVDTHSVMRYDVHLSDFSEVGIADEEDLAFAAFSLAHAACGDAVLEVRIGEHALLEWCMACAVMRIFGECED